MKRTIFLILILFLANAFLTGCAGSGGGGSNGGVVQNPTPVDPGTDPVDDGVFDYVLRVTGTAGTQYAISLTVNFGEADQAQFAPGTATLSVGGDQFPISGRNVLAQWVQSSNGNLTFELFKDGVSLGQYGTNTNGQSAQTTDGL